jgi:hypothetical protein
MAYYIFLKSLRSLEEFRKNPHVKIPPKSPCANFQSLDIFKNQFLFGKEFSPSLSAHPAFRPNLLFLLPADFPPLPHWATAFWPAQPTARLLPPPAPTLPPEEKKRLHLFPLHFPPLIGAIPPVFNPGNLRLQPLPRLASAL